MRTLLIVLALPVLWFFAPIQLHGHTGYAIVSGISMEPKLHDGDLVLLHESPRYKPGDIVAYHSKTSAIVVLHRVLRVRPDGRYVFKGDNNDFQDPTAVEARDLIGTNWARLPKVGGAMLWVRSPLHAILFAGIAILLGAFSRLAPARLRREETAGADRVRVSRRAPASQAQLLAGIALALAGGLWIVALLTPTTKTVVDSSLYEEHATFATTATVHPSSVYPDGRLHSGDAIFTLLFRLLWVLVFFTLGSRLPTTATGKVSLGFDLQSDNGWHTLQPLATAPLRGGKAHLSGSLDLPSIERTAASVDAQTGVRSTRYTLGIVASIATEGTVGGTPISSAYAPRLTYALDKNRLLLVRSSPTEDPFAQSRVGSGLVNRANDFGLGIANLTIHSARTLAGWATALALIALIAAFALGRTRNDEPSRLAWQYGEWLIPIRGLPQTASAVTDVSEFASLVRLADRHNKAILHLDEEGEHTYLVKENGLLYRYTAHDPALTRRALRPAMPDRPNSV